MTEETTFWPDFDEDGALDLVVMVWTGRPHLFLNRVTPGHHWVDVDVDGGGRFRAVVFRRAGALGVRLHTPTGAGCLPRATGLRLDAAVLDA